MTMNDIESFPINLILDITNEDDENICGGNFPADIEGTVDYIISRFDPRVQRVIIGRYKEGKTYEQLGNEFGLTRERIETKALRKMRHPKCREILSLGIAEYIVQIRINTAESSTNKQIAAATEVIKVVADRLSKITGDDELAVMMAKEQLKSRRTITIDDMGLTIRTFNILARAGLRTVDDILNYGDLRDVPHMGQKCLDEITQKIRGLGFEINFEEH